MQVCYQDAVLPMPTDLCAEDSASDAGLRPGLSRTWRVPAPSAPWVAGSFGGGSGVRTAAAPGLPPRPTAQGQAALQGGPGAQLRLRDPEPPTPARLSSPPRHTVRGSGHLRPRVPKPWRQRTKTPGLIEDRLCPCAERFLLRNYAFQKPPRWLCFGSCYEVWRRLTAS